MAAAATMGPAGVRAGQASSGVLLLAQGPIAKIANASVADWAADSIDALTKLRTRPRGNGYLALVISGLAEEAAAELVTEALRLDRDLAVIVHAPELDDARVVEMIRQGAFDVWRDRFADGTAFQARLARSLEFRQQRVSLQRAEASQPWRRMLVGESRAMQQVCETIRLVGPRRSTVLISGETGTGKEMAARALHLASDRKQLQMVAVNCSALPENLLEAELFGHVKGAFTGAFQSRAGRFEQANRGTIFLDEIAEMPLELQAKLLRVLQEREFQRLGSSETVKVDVRVIAACNVDLAERVRQGRFREDLYYRINVVPLPLPALRERRGDVALLAGHFAEKICQAEKVPLKEVSREALDSLERFAWPGNVRQLENAIEMAVALSGDRGVLYPSDFPLPSTHPARTTAPQSPPPEFPLPAHGLDFEATLGRIELSILGQAMERAHGNKTIAADLLGLKRTTLAAKLRSLEGQSRTWTA